MEEKKLDKIKKSSFKKIICSIKNKIDIKNVVHNFFSTRYFIALIGILILLKTIMFYKCTVFYGEEMWTYTVRQSLWYIIMILFPAALIRKPKNRFIYLMLGNFIISFILFADEMYYGYANNILSVMQARKFAI